MTSRFSRAAWLTLTLVWWSSASKAETPYYAGKTITIVAGTKVQKPTGMFLSIAFRAFPASISS
jgi:hypothetical protein